MNNFTFLIPNLFLKQYLISYFVGEKINNILMDFFENGSQSAFPIVFKAVPDFVFWERKKYILIGFFENWNNSTYGLKQCLVS